MNIRILLPTALTAGILSLGLGACAGADAQPSLSTSAHALVQVGEANALCSDLLAGQSTDAGDVCVTVEGGTLTVTYTTSDGWELTEAQMWIGTSTGDMPQTRKGAPKIGNFPYNAGDITGATSWSFDVPLFETFGLTGEEDACDALTFFVAAHASVRKDNGDGTYQTETGWGAGDRFVQRGTWATYFSGALTCSEGGGDPEPKLCETAFAYTSDENAFCVNDITGDGQLETRWGWFGVAGPGSYSFDVYAGAGKCDLSKGTLAGTVSVDYDGSTATVILDADAPYAMDATHVYLANVAQDTLAPGQFTSVQDGEDETSATHTFSGLTGGDIYFSIHAEVCGF